MDCKECGGQLRVTHTHRAGGSATTRRLVCRKCGATHVSVETLRSENERGYGNGAYAQARRLENADDGD